MLLHLTLLGQPVAKGRVRFARKTGHAFTPERTVNYESKLALLAQEKMVGRAPFEGPLAVDVVALMKIPESWSKRKQEQARIGELMPTGRPDLDNYAKILDALNLVCWVDDSQIVELHVYKRFADQPQFTVTISRPGGGFFD
jgi:Holliday junction resolvase RusA-like endonuclease